MSRTFTTPDRVMLLLSLVPYLREHGPTPVPQLAASFEVDPELLRKLVRFLGVAGVPGETGTYQHEDLFDIDWDALEQDDVVSLTQVVAVDDTPRFSAMESAALVAGLSELLAILPDSLQGAATSAAAKLAALQRIDPQPAAISVTPDAGSSSLAVLAEAIESSTAVRFDYRDADGNSSRREVDPYRVWQSGDAWYLRGYCRARTADRTFLVDRIRNAARAESTTKSRSEHSQIEPGAGEMLDQGVTARVRVRSDALHPLAGFGLRPTSVSEGDWILAEVDLLHPATAVRLVQAAPGRIEIVGPPAARDAVREWADRALASYDA